MVLLSFSVKEAELLAGTKVRTTRLYAPEKYRQWQSTIPPNATKLLDYWWKSRTPNGYLMFERPGADLYRLGFVYLNGRYWPFRERDSGLYTPMTVDEFEQYVREEGFEDESPLLMRFFEVHYAPLEGRVFQSIAFPRTVA